MATRSTRENAKPLPKHPRYYNRNADTIYRCTCIVCKDPCYVCVKGCIPGALFTPADEPGDSGPPRHEILRRDSMPTIFGPQWRVCYSCRCSMEYEKDFYLEVQRHCDWKGKVFTYSTPLVDRIAEPAPLIPRESTDLANSLDVWYKGVTNYYAEWGVKKTGWNAFEYSPPDTPQYLPLPFDWRNGTLKITIPFNMTTLPYKWFSHPFWNHIDTPKDACFHFFKIVRTILYNLQVPLIVREFDRTYPGMKLMLQKS